MCSRLEKRGQVAKRSTGPRVRPLPCGAPRTRHHAGHGTVIVCFSSDPSKDSHTIIY